MVWQVRPDSNARNTPELYATEEDPQFNEMRGGKILGDFSLAVIGDFQEGRELLHPEWVPKIFYLRKGPKKFSLIISFRGLFAVQPDVVELIEEFEPGVHQFVPIRIAKAGTMDALPVQYSLVNIGQMLHSVVLDEKVLTVEYIADRVFWMQRRGDVPYLFKREIVLGKHLWRDTGAKSLIFASDAFVQAVEDRDIRGLLKVGYHQEM